MKSKIIGGISALVFPLLGLCGLFLNLANPVRPMADSGSIAGSSVTLLAPDARMNRSYTIFLRQQYRNVAQDRQSLRQAEQRDRQLCTAETAAHVRDRRNGLRLAAADYNLLAHECDFGVFDTTRLPASLNP